MVASKPVEFFLRPGQRSSFIRKVATNLGVAVQREQRVQIGGLQMPQDESRGLDDDHGRSSSRGCASRESAAPPSVCQRQLAIVRSVERRGAQGRHALGGAGVRGGVSVQPQVQKHGQHLVA